MFELVFVFTCLFLCFHLSSHAYSMFSFVFTCLFLCFHLSSHAYSYVFINLQSFRLSVSPLSRAIHQHSFSHLAGAQFLDCITCPPHKVQQSYQPHSAIDPILPSTLSPSKTPGTSSSLTNNTTLRFRVTQR